MSNSVCRCILGGFLWRWCILGWALLGVKIETSMNRLATFHKVGPGRGEHDGEKSFRIGSLICPAVRARSYA